MRALTSDKIGNIFRCPSCNNLYYDNRNQKGLKCPVCGCNCLTSESDVSYSRFMDLANIRNIHYVLTNSLEEINGTGRMGFRIQATADLTFLDYKIKRFDYGGHVESEQNIETSNRMHSVPSSIVPWVFEDSAVLDHAIISGSTLIKGITMVCDESKVYNSEVENSIIHGHAVVSNLYIDSCNIHDYSKISSTFAKKSKISGCVSIGENVLPNYSHADACKNDYVMLIGSNIMDNVFIGHSAILKNSTLRDEVYISGEKCTDFYDLNIRGNTSF